MKTRIAVILSALAFTVAVHAQSTALTYQGDLKNGGQPAGGLHDFRFALSDGGYEDRQFHFTDIGPR
jgi:hypothetical protein